MRPSLEWLLEDETALKGDAQALANFYVAHGQPHLVGTGTRNPALAEVPRGLAARGSAVMNDVRPELRVQRGPATM